MLTSRGIKVLVVSGDAGILDLVNNLLSIFSSIGIESTESPRAALSDMARGIHDAYLVSSTIGETSAVQLFREMMATGCHRPFIMLAEDRICAAEALAAGVTDHLVIDGLDASTLERSLRYSIQRVRQAEETRRVDEEIDRRVRERTQQLESFNKALQAEISIRKQTENALHKQTRILQAILNCMGEGVAVTDENGNFLVFNQVARTLTGLGPVNEQQDRWSEIYGLFYPDEVTPFPDDQLPMRRAMHGEAVDNVEIFINNPQIERGVLVSVNARPLRDASGSIGGGLIVFRDVTEQREAQRALETSLANVRSAHQELESFSYSVSHDLRAPLRHIDGFVNLLRESAGDGLDERSKRYLNVISDAALRMGEMIDRLLELSRAGRIEMRKTRVNLEQMTEAVIEELRQESQGRTIDWTIGPLEDIEGDPGMLRQVITNLLSNAIKYTRPRAEARVLIGMEKLEPHSATFFVRDNGVGFDMRYSDKLFGVFQRLHRNDEFEGTGIGLASVRKIVERHGGRIWADSQVDSGATFYFSLPRARGLAGYNGKDSGNDGDHEESIAPDHTITSSVPGRAPLRPTR